MLLEKIDLQNKYIRKSLLLKDNFESSWVTYKKQYMAALDLLFFCNNSAIFLKVCPAMPPPEAGVSGLL